jgi:hypothetical protein
MDAFWLALSMYSQQNSPGSNSIIAIHHRLCVIPENKRLTNDFQHISYFETMLLESGTVVLVLPLPCV